MNKKITTLLILDGWGISKNHYGNAVYKANTPNYDLLLKKFPNTKISASGNDVGLPEGQMGNSEVGHLNIGAGRIIYQQLTRITKAIKTREIYNNESILNALKYVKKNNSKLHIFGLLSDGGVHSHNKHLYELIKIAKEYGIYDICIHCFTDGRDVDPRSGVLYIKELEEKIQEIGAGRIATIMGRYYAMDRDKRWDRIQKAYDAITKGQGKKSNNPLKAIKDSYKNNVTDEFILPIIIEEKDKELGIVEDNDAIIFSNFRPDRARQITRAFVDDQFSEFERNKVNVKFVCMTQYDESIQNVEVAFKSQKYKNTLGEYVSKLGYKQLRIAETEKYAHVTFFFNGGVEEPNEGEDRILIPSPKVATYDLKPEMSALEVKDEVLKQMKSNKYDLFIINFANPDMVGHTGDFEAAVRAVETVDKCVGEISNYIIKNGHTMIITADHGNCEHMIDEATKLSITAHSTNKVPLIIISNERNLKLNKGILADIAPTLLQLMGEAKPVEMTGESLIINSKLKIKR